MSFFNLLLWDYLSVLSGTDSGTGYSGVMDFVLALLPWKLIWKLQMKRKEVRQIQLIVSHSSFLGSCWEDHCPRIILVTSPAGNYWLTLYRNLGLRLP